MRSIILSLAGMLSCLCIDKDPGFTMSTSVDGMNQIAHLVSPLVFGYLKNLKLPDVEFS
jgi:hypothetical protein